MDQHQHDVVALPETPYPFNPTVGFLEEAGQLPPPPRSGSLYDDLVLAVGRGGGARRAVSGLRGGQKWSELSYDELHQLVNRASAHLARLGLARDDVLVLVMPNHTEAVIYTYAALRLGAVICPVTTIYRRRELQFVLERTSCRIVVAPARYRGFDFVELVHELRGGLSTLETVISVGETHVLGALSSDELLNTPLDPPPPASVSGHDLALLTFTSGTTGEPKGVMHSHGSLHAVIDDYVTHVGLGDHLTSLVMSPFGHGTGSIWGVLMPIRVAGDIVMLETWDPERALDLISGYSVDFTMGATPFLADLLDAAERREDAPLPRTYACAGAPVPPTLVRRAVEKHSSHIVAGWGMSEYPIGTSTAVSDGRLRGAVTDGRPCGRAEVKVVDPGGTPVSVGDEGDVLVRGPGLFKGYYQRPDLHHAALTADGFLRTGDRARLLDDNGHIRICGRTKDIIIRGGENIPVVEIEDLLGDHPSVRTVALVARPDPRLGETACACIVLRPGAAAPPTVAELSAYLNARGVAKQFHPESVMVLDELPRTPSGKVQKYLLQQLADR